MWHAELVGVVRAYPKTQERFDELVTQRRENIALQRAKGVWTRAGVANGTGKTYRQRGHADTRTAKTIANRERIQQRITRIKSHEIAMQLAPIEVKKMMDENFINATTIADAELGNIAIKFVTAVVMDSEQSIKDRLAAVKILAEFTKQKPQTKSEVAFKNSEECLTALADK